MKRSRPRADPSACSARDRDRCRRGAARRAGRKAVRAQRGTTEAIRAAFAGRFSPCSRTRLDTRSDSCAAAPGFLIPLPMARSSGGRPGRRPAGRSLHQPEECAIPFSPRSGTPPVAIMLRSGRCITRRCEHGGGRVWYSLPRRCQLSVLPVLAVLVFLLCRGNRRPPLSLTLPMALLLEVLIWFGRLTGDLELLVLKGIGGEPDLPCPTRSMIVGLKEEEPDSTRPRRPGTVRRLRYRASKLTIREPVDRLSRMVAGLARWLA
jgi:hypothetical protein